MITIINQSTTLFPSEDAARRVADELKSADVDGWDYNVKENGGGKFYIEMVDEDGEIVGDYCPI